jgi:hypothetical protein
MILINRTRLTDWSKTLIFTKKNIYHQVEWEVISKKWLGKSFNGSTLYEYTFCFRPVGETRTEFWIYRQMVSFVTNDVVVAELLIDLNFN